ncbi:MAG: GNAT family N-acetyltransferase [Actinomycetota bacterium]
MITGLLQRRSGGPLRILLDGDISARVRTWPGRPDIAHLILSDHTLGPSASGLKDWVRTIQASGFDIIRTGAISADVAHVFIDVGFHEIQRLALLELDDPAAIARMRKMRTPLYELRQLRSLRSMQLAADIDSRAFEPGWDMDAPSIREACLATPHHHIRLAVTADDQPVGYMVTGRSATTGFVQRLAVDPSYEGLGVGSALLQDGLSWLARHRVDSILVNTHLDNNRALALYGRWGFHRVDQHLQVLEWSSRAQESA